MKSLNKHKRHLVPICLMLDVDTTKLKAEQIAEINRRRKTTGLPLFPETILTYIDIKI